MRVGRQTAVLLPSGERLSKARTKFSDNVLLKVRCDEPGCDSGDTGKAIYDDGHSYCFVCKRTRPAGTYGPDGSRAEVQHGNAKGSRARVSPRPPDGPQDAGREDHREAGPALTPEKPNGFIDLNTRRLKAETLRRYGYFTAGFKGKLVHVAPIYDQNGEIAYQKLRWPDKTFTLHKLRDDAPPINECKLFGQHVYGDRFDRRVVVTEGELDAMTPAQVRDFKEAYVSVLGGAASAAKNLKANYRWLDRFDEIVLWFDDDDAGKAAAEECAKLFKVGKVRLAKVAGFKDASEVLQADRPGDVEAAIFSAVAWRPRGIVNARDNVSDVLAPREKVVSWNYPPAMAKLQEMTGGMHRGEVIYHVAGTGVGKSTQLREIQHHLIEQGVKIGVLSFEDTMRDMKFGLMSIRANERLHLEPLPDPDDAKKMAAYDKKMRAHHEAVFGGGLVELFDPETAEWSMEAILGYTRYCAKALDCEVLFLDPLSFVAAGIEITADERRVLDRCAAEFAKYAKELGIHIQISHHLKRIGNGVPHEEGAPTSLNEVRSSGGLANFASGVIGWERNNQADGDNWRVTRSRIIKPIRRVGKSGVADTLYYDERGRTVVSSIPFPPIGKPQDGESRRSGGFGPINNDNSNADY